ncbi:MAG: GxGYxYP domain-containing protein [Candidatus Omnitrophota bacterium]
MKIIFRKLLVICVFAAAILLSFPCSSSAQIAGKTLYIFDLESYLAAKPDDKVWQYDVINLVSALQGLVNRDAPQLYILYVREQFSYNKQNIDRFWLDKLRSPGLFLADYPITNVKTLEELLSIFRSYYTAVVLWDANVPASANAALTIAGSDGFLPVRLDKSPDSLFTQIVESGPQLPPRERLADRFNAVGNIPDTPIASTGYKKGDAYLWARYFYLDKGMCAPNHFAFFLDPYDWDLRVEGYQYPDLPNCAIVNHDFYVSKKSFFLDLDPWWDEKPTDTPGGAFLQGVDYNLILKDILKSAQKHTPGLPSPILRFGGFVPWWVKYTSAFEGGLHKEEETAERYAAIVSAYNGVIDGDSSPFGALANASVFQHYPLPDRYQQNPVPPPRPLENKNYLLFAIGSFDSSAFLYQTIPMLWDDPNRGKIPLAWALSPITSERTPPIFDYLYQNRTANDYFVSGTAGGGYCYPNRFIYNEETKREYSDLPEEIGEWKKFSKELYRKFDLRMTVAADLDRDPILPVSFTNLLQSHFRSFSPHGVGTLKPYETNLADGVAPFIEETAYFRKKPLDWQEAVKTIYSNSRPGTRKFHLYRFKLTSPTEINFLYDRIRQEHPEMLYEALDPYSFFYLLRQHYANGDPKANYFLPYFISHTIPQETNHGKENRFNAQVVLRNDGWETWNSPQNPTNQRYRLIYNWRQEGEDAVTPFYNAGYVEEPVPPGVATTVNILIPSPDSAGLYRLILILEQENVHQSPIQEEILVTVN